MYKVLSSDGDNLHQGSKEECLNYAMNLINEELKLSPVNDEPLTKENFNEEIALEYGIMITPVVLSVPEYYDYNG